MRRRLLFAAPIAVLLATGLVVAKLHADANDPLKPLKPYVTYQESFFVPGRAPDLDASVEVWAWLKPSSSNQFPSYGKWLTSQQGWNVLMADTGGFQATRGGDLVPDDRISASRYHHDMLVIYSRKVGPVESFFYRFAYRKLDLNTPIPTKP
jgi:hypothetical protein